MHKSTVINLKLPLGCTPVIPSIPLAGLGDTKSIRAANWQDSGDYSQPDPLAGLGDTKSTRASILALTVRASPKLVRQMSSALTKLKANWMSVDIVISEGNLFL